MRPSTLGNVLLIAGAAVAVVAVVAVVTGYSPNLTPEMTKLLFYKGLGAAAVGLMIVGTLIGRVGRRREKQEAAPAKSSASRSSSDPMLRDATPGIESIDPPDVRESLRTRRS